MHWPGVPKRVAARGARAAFSIPSRAMSAVRRTKRHFRANSIVDLGNLRSTEPISEVSGYDRGLPIDRYYIERFLNQNADLISGAVLEIGDDAYTRRFGGSRVTRSDVMNIS